MILHHVSLFCYPGNQIIHADSKQIKLVRYSYLTPQSQPICFSLYIPCGLLQPFDKKLKRERL